MTGYGARSATTFSAMSTFGEVAGGKDPRRQLIGVRSKAEGKRFEARLDAAFAYYDKTGFAAIEKTPEPLKPISSLGQGRFVACFEKKAQPDYKGILKGGREIMFEAKFTSTDRMEQSRVLAGQADYMDKHQRLGARCYVVVGFARGEVYRIPWDVWRDMKSHFGRKYVTEADLDKYRVQTAWNGTLLLI